MICKLWEPKPMTNWCDCVLNDVMMSAATCKQLETCELPSTLQAFTSERYLSLYTVGKDFHHTSNLFNFLI